MGQQASHQGKSQEFSWFDMCLFKLSINACRVFKCYFVLNVENSVLNLNSFSHLQWKYSFKLNHVTSHQLGSNKLQNLIFESKLCQTVLYYMRVMGLNTVYVIKLKFFLISYTFVKSIYFKIKEVRSLGS